MVDQHAAVLPAGEYLIIDPSYMFEGPRFLALCDAMLTDDSGCVSVDPQTGAAFAYSSTATGDGVYADQEGHRYGVDAGMLACLPLAMLDAVALVLRPTLDHSEGQVCCGRIVAFPAPFACVPCDATGVIRFGYITIETGPSWDEDEDEEN
jgi:hypothetical protein